MGDLQRRALASDLARRQQQLNLDELRVIDRVQQRIELGRQRYGELDLAAPRDWRAERFEEQLDALVYQVCAELSAEDLARQSLREAAHAEMAGEIDQRPPRRTLTAAAQARRDAIVAIYAPAQAGEFASEQHRTRVTDESARIAATDIDDGDPYEEWTLGDSEGGGG